MATVNCTFSIDKAIASIPKGPERDKAIAWVDDWLGISQPVSSAINEDSKSIRNSYTHPDPKINAYNELQDSLKRL